MSGLWLTSYSSWNAFRTCQQKFYWQYMRGLVPVEDDPAYVFGTLIHQALEEHAKGGLEEMGRFCDTWLKGREDDPEVRDLWEKAVAMLHGYLSPGHWVRDQRGDDGLPSQIWRKRIEPADDRECYPSDGLRILEVEKWFSGPIVNPATGHPSKTALLRGKIDAIGEDSSGRLWCLERKTATPGFIRHYLAPQWYDLQAAAYVYAAREILGYEVVGVIHDVMLKTQIRQKDGKKTAETLPEFWARVHQEYQGSAGEDKFLRIAKPMPPHAVAQMHGDLWGMIRVFKEAVKADMWVRNTASCFDGYRTCKYVPKCWGEDTPDVWAQYVQTRGMQRTNDRKDAKEGQHGGDRVSEAGDDPVRGVPGGRDGAGEGSGQGAEPERDNASLGRDGCMAQAGV